MGPHNGLMAQEILKGMPTIPIPGPEMSRLGRAPGLPMPQGPAAPGIPGIPPFDPTAGAPGGGAGLAMAGAGILGTLGGAATGLINQSKAADVKAGAAGQAAGQSAYNASAHAGPSPAVTQAIDTAMTLGVPGHHEPDDTWGI